MLVFTFEPFEQVLELKQNKFTNYDYKDTLYAKPNMQFNFETLKHP